jgi:predicted DNA-binding antitoxin AbrB/MazE fold protein
MILTFDAIFDGRVFRPIQPITLPANTRVQIAVTTEETKPLSFLDVAEALALDGPPDWSLQLDEYLYGGRQLNGS